jgi:hypothetical protein
MHLSVVIAIILLIVVFGGLFSYRVNAVNTNASYQTVGSFVAGIAALLLFLMAIGVLNL